MGMGEGHLQNADESLGQQWGHSMGINENLF